LLLLRGNFDLSASIEEFFCANKRVSVYPIGTNDTLSIEPICDGGFPHDQHKLSKVGLVRSYAASTKSLHVGLIYGNLLLLSLKKSWSSKMRSTRQFQAR
jgi:hypothetical protein